MQPDPRFKNEVYDLSSTEAFVKSYASRLQEALASVDTKAIEAALQLVQETAARNKKIHVMGNGGSSAIAQHLCCDFTKGTHAHPHAPVSTFSMTDNVALYSAIANDYGFENVFSQQVEFNMREGDLVIAISSSGNSANIIKGVEKAKEKNIQTIGMSGFSGGKLKDISDISLYVAANNYGVVEDAHQALMHIIAQLIAHKRDGRKG